ncbi:ChaN family lipoprotein [Emcibacter sp.]|uniref:ChaN family lipoprotein n=1 Tax=Emcibacter sp. TaxID=1979954 RepID=UPI002AA875BC|nr:ChaN family lipoprotein [Emcibacter sp.]
MRLIYFIVLAFLALMPLSYGNDLAGKIWDVGRQKIISENDLEKELKNSRFVLLGEVHDNRHHHELQAKLLDRLTGSGRDRAVVFEMVERNKQNAFKIFRSRFNSVGPADTSFRRHDASGLEILLDWQNSGWPDWSWYKPLFDIAMRNNLPLGAGGLSRFDVGAVHKQGLAGLSPALREKLAPWLAVEWPDSLNERLLAEIRQGHCNALPEDILPPFVLIQRLRDASLGQSLTEQAANVASHAAILIAGNGHVRNDMAVPYYLRKMNIGGSIATVGFIEVTPGSSQPTDYAAQYGLKKLPYDFVWFTEVAKREDPCELFRQNNK